MEAGLSRVEIGRYSRQLILPEWGVKGQALIKSTSVLVVGVGGLGCPASLYLTAAGIGHLGLLDYDSVELNNLHRQVLHTEQSEGTSKVSSAKNSLAAVNSLVKCSTHHLLLCKENALDILSGYDIVLDCTDNVVTRYLLNDACVLLGKPLISGSALRFEGQLTVYHHQGGPCYRCLFPKPPPAHTVTNCSEGGVLGPVPGMMGTMQALEALKIAAGTGSVLTERMLVFDGLTASFRTVKLRPRQSNCSVCGENPSITGLIDYETFCGSCANDKVHDVSVLNDTDRISCTDYRLVLDSGQKHLLIDVRDKVEFQICHLHTATNLPLKDLQTDMKSVTSQLVDKFVSKELPNDSGSVCVYVCCHRGNDSQHAVVLLRKALTKILPSTEVLIKDLKGGLEEWANTVDNSFPKY